MPQPELSKPALRRVLAVMVAAVLLLAILFIPRLNHRRHTLELKAYFKNAEGLRVGAPVRVSGVEVGSITSVRVRAERRAAEVLMRLQTSYPLRIPKDALAEVATAGVMGDTFVEINLGNASGPAAEAGDELGVRESGKPGGLELYFGPRRTSPPTANTQAPSKPGQ